MRDKLITIGGGLLALFIMYALLSPPIEPDITTIPTTTDKKPAGLYAVKEFLTRSGIKTGSLRHRYDRLLIDTALEESNNLLVVTSPVRLTARGDELEQLRSWLKRGNDILLLVANRDIPLWATQQSSQRSRSSILDALGFYLDTTATEPRQSKIDRGKAFVEKGLNLDKGSTRVLVPEISMSVTDSVTALETSDSIINEYDLDLTSGNPEQVILEMFSIKDTKSVIFWQARYGDGRVWISAYSNIFSNKFLSSRDNAQLILNLASLSTENKGSVIFDDMHQGLTELYDPDAFYNDRRLHNTLYFLLGFWLLLLVGRSVRLTPLARDPERVSAARLVKGVGGLFARTLPQHVVASGIMKHTFNEIRGQYNMPQNGEPVWDVLEASPRVQQAHVNSLKQLHNNTLHYKKINLEQLRNLLLTIRKSLL